MYIVVVLLRDGIDCEYVVLDEVMINLRIDKGNYETMYTSSIAMMIMCD